MQKARSHTVIPKDNIVLPLLVSKRFQVLFTPLTGVLFTFPSRYWFTIGHQVVFSLMRWSSLIPTGFLVSRGTWVFNRKTDTFDLQDFHLLWCDFPDASIIYRFCNFRVCPKPDRMNPATPHIQRFRAYIYRVWAFSRSLAATWKITIVFFSWGY